FFLRGRPQGRISEGWAAAPFIPQARSAWKSRRRFSLTQTKCRAGTIYFRTRPPPGPKRRANAAFNVIYSDRKIQGYPLRGRHIYRERRVVKSKSEGASRTLSFGPSHPPRCRTEINYG